MSAWRGVPSRDGMELTARVTFVGAVNQWTKAGIMVRRNLGPGPVPIGPTVRRDAKELRAVLAHAIDSVTAADRSQLAARWLPAGALHGITGQAAKLTPAMINTWIWSPKAFRPSTKMPHFFMLENNSSDEELRRTRQEARAITEYLVQTATPLPPKHVPPLDDQVDDAIALTQLALGDAEDVAGGGEHDEQRHHGEDVRRRALLRRRQVHRVYRHRRRQRRHCAGARLTLSGPFLRLSAIRWGMV